MIFEPINLNDIMREYEQTRQDNESLQIQRRKELYSKFPAIEELDNQSTASYISMIKGRLSGEQGENADTKSIIQTNKGRTAEKKRLLVEAGYPENYLDPIYTCSKCMDTGYIDQERCSCFRDKLISNLYLQSNMSNILEKENFETFNLSYYSKEVIPEYNCSPYDNMVNILTTAKEFVNNFSTKASHRGNILIYGEVGLGKTFLTNCIAKAILDKGHQSPGQSRDISEFVPAAVPCAP